ncbi:MAG: hypothetical protein SF029_02300 [bacterium]|nr:hypothetical protein [bacterium]
MEGFSLSTALINGLALCLLMGISIIVSLFVNVRVWMQDFPAEVQAAIPPLSPAEKRQRLFFAVPILAAFFGVLGYTILQLRALPDGEISFVGAYLTLLIVFQMFNLFDAVVIDWLLLIVWKPAAVHVPGTEGLEHTYESLRFQFTAFMKGLIGGIVFCLPLALLAVL